MPRAEPGRAERIIRRVRAEHDIDRLTDAHQHEHDRVVRDRVGRIACVRHADAQALCRLKIYVVVSDGAQRGIAHAVFCELLQNRRRKIASAGNAVEAARQAGVVDCQRARLKLEVHVQRLTEVIEKRAFVRTGVENAITFMI